MQDTLLQTFRRLNVFEVRGPGALLAYLRQAVLNRVRNELRKKGRRPEETDLDGLEVAVGQSPLEAAIGKEAVDRYERALAALTPDEREADHRARGDGLSRTTSWPSSLGKPTLTPRARLRSGRSCG